MHYCQKDMWSEWTCRILQFAKCTITSVCIPVECSAGTQTVSSYRLTKVCEPAECGRNANWDILFNSCSLSYWKTIRQGFITLVSNYIFLFTSLIIKLPHADTAAQGHQCLLFLHVWWAGTTVYFRQSWIRM